MMTFLEAHISNFGEFHYQGHHYVLISQPYTYMAKDETPHYNADAVCPEDERGEDGFQPVYNVRWPVKNQHLIDYCTARLEHDNKKALKIMDEWNVNEETVDIDNWDEPFSVNLTMYKYNIEDVSRRYSWD